MPINKHCTKSISGYVPTKMAQRMKRIAKARPRLTLSFQIEAALETYLPTLEAQCGFKSKASKQLMP